MKFNFEDAPVMKRMCRELGFNYTEFFRLFLTAPKRYKVYSIPKRNGSGSRVIAHPSQELKLIQTWITDNVLNKFPVHRCATAYEEGRSILDNASPHAKKKFLLKMDFNNFFPSLKPDDLKKLISDTNDMSLGKSDLVALQKFLFRLPKGAKSLEMSVGAPSSPKFSNVIMFQFDAMISDFCKREKVIYTRYADDLTFSTNRSDVLETCEKEVGRVLKKIKYPKLTINEQKTVFSSKKTMRRVTGLILSSEGKVSLGRDKKRLLRSQIHYFQKRKLSAIEAETLRGHLAYAHAVEPSFLERMKRCYGDKLIEKIQRFERDE